MRTQSFEIALALSVGMIVLAAAGGAAAQEAPGARGAPESPWSFRASIGFTASPGSFLLSAELPYAVNDHVFVGPLLQLGLSSDDKIVAPSANVQYVFDTSGVQNEILNKLEPFLQGGVGFAYIHKDRRGRRGRDRDDVGFMFNFGGGVEYRFNETVSLGTNMLFNILPVDTAGENFFFSWQVATVRFRF